MRWLFLFLLTPLLLQAADEQVNWSQPVKGLRARLFISSSRDPDFDYNFQVYLQFENVGEVGNLGTIRIEKTFQYSEMGLALEVTDATGQKLPRVGPGVGDEMVPGYNLCLPFGGNLAFPIGYGWAAIPSYPLSIDGPLTPAMLQGKYLKISSLLGWVIPTTGSGTYYLSGTFSTKFPRPNPPRNLNVRLNWEGTLVLPPVEIPQK